MTTVACDVCGERYEVARSAFGRMQKCKMCLVPFEVCSHTVAPDVDESQADDTPEISEVAVVKQAVGTGITTFALVGCFVWMASLPFRDPRAVPNRESLATNSVTPTPGSTPANPDTRFTSIPAATTSNPQSPPTSAATLPDGSRFSNPAATNAAGTTANTTTGSTSPGPLPGDMSPNSSPSQASEPIRLRIGLVVQVRKDNVVRRATVLRVISNDMVQVRYLDYQVNMPLSETVKADQIEQSPGNTPPNVSPSTSGTNRPNPSQSVVVGQYNYNGPGSIPSSGRKVTSAAQLTIQQIVQVQWGQGWYPADVIRINPNGTIRVHYRGWSNASDEDVALSRIQLAHGAPEPTAVVPPVAATASPRETPPPVEDGQLNYNGPGKVLSSGRKVTKYSQLKPGLIVQVAWGSSGAWFPANIIRRNNDGTVRIHYRGFSDSHDEDVPLEKIQFAHDGINKK